MRFESTVEVFRLLLDVFDYLARAEFLPEYAADFVWVNETSGQGPRLGAEYAYRMKSGSEGSFRRMAYEPHSRPAWQGPPAKAGLGTMAPARSWELSTSRTGTRVMLVMAPVPGDCCD